MYAWNFLHTFFEVTGCPLFLRFTPRLCHGVSRYWWNLLLLRLHAEPDPSASEPYMQAMHFSFALGALAIPLVMSALNNLTVSFITIAILLLVVFFNFTFVSLNSRMQSMLYHVKAVGVEKSKRVKL